ncbi:MerR family transcriptional regulator [Paenibacillus paeoniae]|uniref:MerR family transcriptional regulator n=1 Tax=Paenibacillus paeoniae TaxID=2292705 RepID=A0A371PLC0_9BACL|nr:MerR family transcriptional regulator [Paenibacillus paeoniae]REK76991.1 MerR family transcriptional regulator [Paenibacillus paeoniae]
MRFYRPIDIARELGISTSALRHYESWGVIPSPERSANGYRQYTEVHAAYFRCLRAMFPGFGVSITCQTLKHVQHGEMDAAFWLVNKEQASLHEEKTIADQTLALLQQPDLPPIRGKKRLGRMSIGEAATYTNVQASAIRHWEKEGLIVPDRDPENGYRVFGATHIRQILLIRTLRRTVYLLDSMRDIVKAVEHHDVEKAKQVTEQALFVLHGRNRLQLSGVHQLVELCRIAGLLAPPFESH